MNNSKKDCKFGQIEHEQKKRLGGIYEKYCKNAILPRNHNFLINVRIRVRVRVWMMGIISEDEEEDQIKRVEWT